MACRKLRWIAYRASGGVLHGNSRLVNPTSRYRYTRHTHDYSNPYFPVVAKSEKDIGSFSILASCIDNISSMKGAGSQLSGVEELASYLSGLLNSKSTAASTQISADCQPYVLSAMALLLNQIWPQHTTIDQLCDANKLLGQCERKLHSPRLGNAIVKNALKDFLGGAHVDLDTLPAALAERNGSKWDCQAGKSHPLTLACVHQQLFVTATDGGPGSSKRKQQRLQDLFERCQNPVVELPRLCQLATGQGLRFGLSDRYSLVALAIAFERETGRTDQKARDEAALAAAVQAVHKTFDVNPDVYALVNSLLDGRGQPVANTLKHSSTIVPLHFFRPMLATACKTTRNVLAQMAVAVNSHGGGADEAPEMAIEYKYDGIRLQAHRGRAGEVRLFTRKPEDVTDRYSTLVPHLAAAVDGDAWVLDGELVAIAASHDASSGIAQKRFEVLEFSDLTRRPRKGAARGDTELAFVAFDLLHLDGRDLTSLPFRERRSLMRDILDATPANASASRDQLVASMGNGYVWLPQGFDMTVPRTPDPRLDQSEAVEAENMLSTEVAQAKARQHCDGVIVKALNGPYQCGHRGVGGWIKLKTDAVVTGGQRQEVADSLDLVPIAAFNGKGKRKGVWGSFLMATWCADSQRFQSVCKLGSGFTQDQLSLFSTLPQYEMTDSGAPKAYELSARMLAPKSRPDAWLRPKEVWEVTGLQLSLSPTHTAGNLWVQRNFAVEHKGVSLRFPKFVRRRSDKDVSSCTPASVIAELLRESTEGKR